MRRLRKSISIYAVTGGALLLASCGDVDVSPSSSRSLPPDAVDDAALVYVAGSAEAVLTWTVPRTRGGTRELARYDIGLAYGDPVDWERAQAAPDPPRPGAGGERQAYRVRYPQRGRMLHARVRCVDASGNFSAPGNVASLAVPGYTVSGRAQDVFSDAPLPGVMVTLAGRTTKTMADGTWRIDDVSPVESVLCVGTAGYFPVELAMVVAGDRSVDLELIPLGMSEVLPAISRLGLFREALGVRTGDPVLRRWRSFPLGVFVPGYTSAGGIDYREAALSAMDRWVELTGIPLFESSTDALEADVTIAFESPAEMGIHIGITSYDNTPDGHPLRSRVRIVDTIENDAVLRRVLLHELGHAMRLKHLPSGFLMYAGQPLPDDPTGDEIRVVRLLAALRDLTDTSIYAEVTP